MIALSASGRRQRRRRDRSGRPRRHRVASARASPRAHRRPIASHRAPAGSPTTRRCYRRVRATALAGEQRRQRERHAHDDRGRSITSSASRRREPCRPWLLIPALVVLVLVAARLGTRTVARGSGRGPWRAAPDAAARRAAVQDARAPAGSARCAAAPAGSSRGAARDARAPCAAAPDAAARYARFRPHRLRTLGLWARRLRALRLRAASVPSGSVPARVGWSASAPAASAACAAAPDASAACALRLRRLLALAVDVRRGFVAAGVAAAGRRRSRAGWAYDRSSDSARARSPARRRRGRARRRLAARCFTTFLISACWSSRRAFCCSICGLRCCACCSAVRSSAPRMRPICLGATCLTSARDVVSREALRRRAADDLCEPMLARYAIGRAWRWMTSTRSRGS